MEHKSTRKPNILFLLNDHQVHYRHGWDGGPVISRPAFDRLAGEGISFSRAYSVCPLCGPARRSMLTGLYPHTHREIQNDVNHPYDQACYLDTLAAQGYKNYYYGKWHAGPGTAHDHSCEGFSFPSYNNPYTKPEYEAYLTRMGLSFPEILVEHSFMNPAVPKATVEGALHRQTRNWCNEHASGIMQAPKEAHEAFFLAHLACDKLRELARTPSEEPFHLRVDFWGPHQPYFPTADFAALYRPQDIPPYGSFNDDLSTKPPIYRREGNHRLHQGGQILYPNPVPWSTWQEVLARAYAQVTLVDAAGGLILDTLRELGLEENTLVVWTTDHGDALACHGGHFDKSSYMPEEMIRVPFAMKYPGHIPAGVKSNSLVSNLDVAPTLLSAAGLSFEKPVHGIDLLSQATGITTTGRDYFVSETAGHGEKHTGRAVVTERWKYIFNMNQMEELYDLESDPYEMVNLALDPGQAERLVGMRDRLHTWQREFADPEPGPALKNP